MCSFSMSGNADTVAAHYNAVPQAGLGARAESRIFYMRNLNNWIKSMLINEAVDMLRKDGTRNARVLDLACGKGGDLRKWKIANVDSVVMADIADVSVEQAKGRYEEMKERDRGRIFPAQFIAADCSTMDLAPMMTSSRPFDLVSCQFALHYAFEKEELARQFLKNAAASLRPGGLFIGTLPDANRIMWSCRAGDGAMKNAVCEVSFEDTTQLQTAPLFGAKFHFLLDKQVNCPEFLAYFPLLEHLCAELDLELVFCRSFPDAIEHYLEKDGRGLLGRMNGLEPFPAAEGNKLSGEEGEYADAQGLVDLLKQKGEERSSVGSISRSEWEAVCMYLVFAFRKKGEKPVEKKEEKEKEQSKEVKRKASDEEGHPVEEKRAKVEQEQEPVKEEEEPAKEEEKANVEQEQEPAKEKEKEQAPGQTE